MKKVLFFVVLASALLASCSPEAMKGSPAAVQAGAAIGGVLGTIVGDRAGGYNGSQFGSLLGTVAGAAVGNALTTPRKEKQEDDGCYVESRSVPPRYEQGREGAYYEDVAQPVSGLEITNLRFIDDNRDHVIDALEDSKLVFDIVNNGTMPAHNVTPVVEETVGLKHLGISSSVQIAFMPVGDCIRYTATIRGGKKLKTGKACFRVYAVEGNGAVTDVHEFSLPTAKRKK